LRESDLILVTENRFKKKILESKTAILSRIKKEIGERRIDLTIFSKDDLPTDPFYQTIKDEKILLKKWAKSAECKLK